MSEEVIGWVDHDSIPGIKLQRQGNKVLMRYSADRMPGGAHALEFDARLFYHDLFERDNRWALSRASFLDADKVFNVLIEFESIHDRTKVINLADTTEPKANEGAQTLNLMQFRDASTGNESYIAQGHVGAREFRRAMHAIEPEWDEDDFKYEYAVFRDDESILFNVRPDETGCKPVTVAYVGEPVKQL